MYFVKSMVRLLNFLPTYSMYFIKALVYEKKKFGSNLRFTNTFFPNYFDLFIIYIFLKQIYLRIGWI